MAHPVSSKAGYDQKFQIGAPPAASAAGTVNGTGVDRYGFHSVVVEVQTGATTGTPTTQTLDVKLQHSDSSGSGYADFQPDGTAASGAVAQLTAANTRKRKTISLDGAKRYIRAVAVTAFTGGASPTLASAVVLCLKGAVEQPAQADD